MTVELLATCWTHAGDAVPVPGRRLSPLDLRARAEAVAAAGFTGIGFTIDDLEPPTPTYDLRQVKQICDDLGLVAPRGRAARELVDHRRTSAGSRTGRGRRCCRPPRFSAARQVKIGPDVQVVDGVVPPLADVAHWADELHQLAAQAAGVGTRVALEPLPFSNIADFRLAAELVTAADHPAAGLVVDIWHLERGPSTLADLGQVPGDKVFVVELNDAPEPQSADLFHDTIDHRVLCGSGTFDVKGFIETLRLIGLCRPLGCRDPLRGTPQTSSAEGPHRRAPHHDGAVRQPDSLRRETPTRPGARVGVPRE